MMQGKRVWMPRLGWLLIVLLGVFGAWTGAEAQEASVDSESAPAGDGSAEAGELDTNRFLSKLTPDEALYFAIGWREFVNAKFQFSFKFAFMNPQGALTRKAPFFSHVYFGYTQTSLWDIEGESKPFYDTSYKPTLFYRHEDLHRSDSGDFRIWGQAGYQHESNGQGDEESRSLDIIYVKPVFEFSRFWGRGHLTVAPRVWAYVSDLDDNPDIAEYRGYGDLRLAYTGRSDWQVAATIVVGTSGKGSVQLDGTWPMDKILGRNFDGYLYVQYFDGWGESLRSYDQHLPWQLRLGIAVVR
ncbi:MAG: phospholipase A [Acidobacteriota bacterium]